jgi:hypothetical protein
VTLLLSLACGIVRMRRRKAMSWVRAQLRLGSCIALFALACQLVISLGHVHLEAVTRNSSVAVATSGGTIPAGDGPSDRADHRCPICALIHLAGTLVLSEPPVVPLPIVFAQQYPGTVVKFGFEAAPPTFFSARAPPLA